MRDMNIDFSEYGLDDLGEDEALREVLAVAIARGEASLKVGKINGGKLRGTIIFGLPHLSRFKGAPHLRELVRNYELRNKGHTNV